MQGSTANREASPDQTSEMKRRSFTPTLGTLCLVAGALLAHAPTASAAHSWYFGGIGHSSVSIDDRTAVIGFPSADDWSGAVDIYQRSGYGWIKETTLTIPIERSAFGHSVAIDGETILVGAPLAQEAYVFARHDDQWIYEGTLAPPPDSEAEVFGWSVALDGNTALIGSRKTQEADPDSAFVFVRSDGMWSLDAHFLPDPTLPARFGWSVALQGDRALVGAPGDISNAGVVGYAKFFLRTEEGWTSGETLTPPSPEPHFGGSVAIDGHTVVVGPGTANWPSPGVVHVFGWGTASWEHQATLQPDWSEGFGSSVAIEGDLILAGAPGDSERAPYSGAVHVFRRGAGTWSDHRKLMHPEGIAQSWLGYSVAIDQGVGLAGSDGTPRFLDQDILDDLPPEPQDDFFETTEEESLSVSAPGVLANDRDPDGDPMTAELWWRHPEHGHVTLRSDGSFTYTPGPDFSGSDSFTYQVCAGWGCADPVRAWIEVLPVNDPPVVQDVTGSTNEDTGTLIRLRAADRDSALTYEWTSPSNGTLSGQAPDLIYSPARDFNGTDSFTFRAFDGELWSNEATVTITVNPVNDRPNANDDAANTPQYEPVVIDVLANDADVDGNPLQIISVSQPEHGQAMVDDDGTITYDPDPSFKFADWFSYSIADPSGLTATATVTITEIGCGEDGTASETIDRELEPGVAEQNEAAARVIHDTNCEHVVAIEDALDNLIF